MLCFVFPLSLCVISTYIFVVVVVVVVEGYKLIIVLFIGTVKYAKITEYFIACDLVVNVHAIHAIQYQVSRDTVLCFFRVLYRVI